LAEEFGVTSPEVRQQLRRAVVKIRNAFKDNELPL